MAQFLRHPCGRRALGPAGPLPRAALVLAIAWLCLPSSAQGGGGMAGMEGMGGMSGQAAHSMTDEDMARWVADFYATHPRHGAPASLAGAASAAPAAPAAAPADTVFVSNFLMNANGNTATPFDTVTVVIGQSVLFQWVNGTHTTTSGTDPLDPQAGVLWDQPITLANPQWVQSFPTEGVFPFFCRVHPSSMRGWVKVVPPIGVDPSSSANGRIGFVAGPLPNPTTGGVSFRFALAQAGHVRAEIVDVRGRLVDVVLDDEMGAGTFGASWDASTRDGARAAPGVYRLRLTLPGFAGSRQVVMAR